MPHPSQELIQAARRQMERRGCATEAASRFGLLADQFKVESDFDSFGFRQCLLEIEGPGGILPPVLPTLRGKLGRWIIRLQARLMWWVVRALRASGASPSSGVRHDETPVRRPPRGGHPSTRDCRDQTAARENRATPEPPRKIRGRTLTRASIDQFSPSVRERDAIGNGVVALQTVLTKLGYSSRIFGEEAGTIAGQRVHHWKRYCGSDRDLLLIHYSYGSAAYEALCSLPQRKIFLYHAPTPVKYLAGLNPAMPATAVQAVNELPRYANSVDTAVAHSAFTARELQAAGYGCIQVVPYLLYEPLYQLPPAKEILGRFQGDGWKNLLAVGRVVPNKRLEDCLFVLDFLKRYVDPHWRLFLVGSWKGAEAYKERLRDLLERMNLKDIYLALPAF